MENAKSHKYDSESSSPFALFLQCSDQKEVAAKVLLQAAKQQVNSLIRSGSLKWRYADIGCGSGDISGGVLSKMLADYPRLTICCTMIERRRNLLKKTSDSLHTHSRLLTRLINKRIEALAPEKMAPWGGNHFVVCSHVLSYLDDWPAQIIILLRDFV